MKKKPIPILASPVERLLIPEGMGQVAGYHGYGTVIGHADPETGEILQNAIIIAGSIDDLRNYVSALIPAHKFDESKVPRVTLVGTEFVKLTDDEL